MQKNLRKNEHFRTEARSQVLQRLKRLKGEKLTSKSLQKKRTLLGVQLCILAGSRLKLGLKNLVFKH